jgi:hypothetical protein
MREVRKKLPIVVVAAVVALAAVVNVWGTFGGPVHWTPDALYYQQRVLELRGADHEDAVARTFGGSISAELRAIDPGHTGNAEWVAYNEPFYERRVAVPLAGAAVYGLDGESTLLDISLLGYVAALVALFVFLLLRFRPAVAAGVTLATVFLPPLVDHASYPLTDSWGLALEITAFVGALLTLDRGRQWLALWIPTILVLAFTRDSTWIPILAVGWCAIWMRSRRAVWLFGTGLAAALPALLLFSTPVKNLLALLVNESNVPADPSWSFVVRHYPGAVIDLVRANGGFLRDGEWYTALYLVGGVVLLLVLAARRRGRGRRDATTALMTAGAAVSLLYVLAAPVFSAFRLELVFVPMAAYALALGLELVLARIAGKAAAPDAVAASPAP